MQRLALTLFAIAFLLGLWLVARKGLGILVFGLLGVGSGLLYSMPQVMLSGRGIGEAVIGLSFGVVPLVGAAWLQSGIVDSSVLLLSLPVSLWIAAVLLINEVPDRAADAHAGKRTLPVRLGLQGTRRLYEMMHGVAAIVIATLVWVNQLPAVSLALAAPLLAVGLITAGRIPGQDLRGAIKATLAIHALGSIGLTGIILWGA